MNKQIMSMFTKSLFIALISLVVIYIVPVNVSVKEPKIGPSPYRAEIDELYKKTSQGLPPQAPEWAKLTEAREKNKQWFETDEQENSILKKNNVTKLIQKKSSKVGVLLMLIWGAATYLIAKSSFILSSATLVFFPTLLYVIEVYSLSALVMVVFAIMGVNLFLLLSQKSGNQSSEEA
jgi:hypothetical protein